jgi:hypothetical protein
MGTRGLLLHPMIVRQRRGWVRDRRSDQQYQPWLRGCSAQRTLSRARIVGGVSRGGSGDAVVARGSRLLRLFVMLTNRLPKCFSWVLRPPGRSYGRAGPLTLRQRDRPSVLDMAGNLPLSIRLRGPFNRWHACAETAGSACPLQAQIKDQRKPMRYIVLCGIEPPSQPHLTLRLSAAIEGALHWYSMLPDWPRHGSIQRAAGRHSGQAN